MVIFELLYIDKLMILKCGTQTMFHFYFNLTYINSSNRESTVLLHFSMSCKVMFQLIFQWLLLVLMGVWGVLEAFRVGVSFGSPV